MKEADVFLWKIMKSPPALLLVAVTGYPLQRVCSRAGLPAWVEPLQSTCITIAELIYPAAHTYNTTRTSELQPPLCDRQRDNKGERESKE
ncbi:hypothetical protein JZ751_028732 [Albula glossodonta]|uniref:Uncharacterized protein n=1 Tax=Albula glossodonta TaxID=121402 RepID=A0A8T2NEV5_9TELE|nr:hypothetical protein JZ751_028732 [Albula glossodonta]